MADSASLGSSFRDPSGFVFEHEGTIFRQVNQCYRESYELLQSSGVYDRLTKSGLLISHEEIDSLSVNRPSAYKILKPDRVPFISYPYEWSFSQLKDAALTTLEIQESILDLGMSLKDASAYNIQFVNCRPMLIDSLSFEPYREGKPWVAYRQFCQHFLAPLALMAHVDVRLGRMLQTHIDGIPLDLASKILPIRTYFRFSLLTHVHLHARSISRHGQNEISSKTGSMSKRAMVGIIQSLRSAVNGLNYKPHGTEWADYYYHTNYSEEAAKTKERLVAEFIERVKPSTVWDLGANVGTFSRLASSRSIATIAFDIDPAAVEKNYRLCRQSGESGMLPLVLDLTNPSPALGWAHRERSSFIERGEVDMVMALALIHHLAIGNNLPLEQISEFMSTVGRTLIVEFVPREDSQVKRMLSSREDIFSQYSREQFETAFAANFIIERREALADSKRTLYLMRRKRP